ncbi:hypothetical protein OnM2_025126 [Erysiphe neolycopersici]|uniref:Uncharacterized protein n=1 Tax=Erysiphe neolycopersici TaxID=212602 RepID=A0A420I1G4_9PEZI|nr:hypothetical protein OnM2_025126 [Erysiphe neolycopersici]
MVDRKPRGRPRKDASHSSQLLIDQPAQKVFSEITNTASIHSSNIEPSQNPQPQSLSPPESKSILNSSFPQPNYDSSLLNDTPAVSPPISGLPGSDSGHNLSFSNTINEIPAETSSKADSATKIHSASPGKSSQRKKKNSTHEENSRSISRSIGVFLKP